MLAARMVLVLCLAVVVAVAACGPDTSDCRVLKVCAPSNGGAGSGGTGGAGIGGGPGDVGAPCSSAGECSTGQCVDGVCCESACDGPCLTCAAAGNEGTCSPQPAGTDPDNDCAAGVCDGVDGCASGEHLWSKRFGGTGYDFATSITIGPADAMSLAGGYGPASQPDFGGGPLPALTTVYAAFAAELDGQGNHVWSKRIAESSYTTFSDHEALTVRARDAGELAIVGGTDEFVDLGSGPVSTPSIGPSNMFVGVVGANGTPQHLELYEGMPSFARDVAWLSGSHVIIGWHTGSITIGTEIHPDPSDDALLLARFDGATARWSRSYPGTLAYPSSQFIRVAPDGSIYAAGAFEDDLAAGTPPLSAAGRRIFVIRLDPDGNALWSRAYGSATTDLRGMAIDASGAIYLGGSFTQTTDFGGPTLTSAGNMDAFVAALDADGEHRWSRRFGTTGDQKVSALDTSTSHLLVTGTFVGSVDLGGGALSDEGGFVAKLTVDGEHVWSRALVGPIEPRAIAAASDDGCVVAGQFAGNADFGGSVLTASGTSDVFVARFGR